MSPPRVLLLSGTGVDHEAARLVAEMLAPRGESTEVIVERARERITARAASLEQLALAKTPLVRLPLNLPPAPRFVPGRRKRWRRSQRRG